MFCCSDWIKPGEFTFCSRCGDICHIGGINFQCFLCLLSFPVDIRDEQLRHEYDILHKAEKKISDVVCETREKIAKYRRDELKLKRLFWMNNE